MVVMLDDSRVRSILNTVVVVVATKAEGTRSTWRAEEHYAAWSWSGSTYQPGGRVACRLAHDAARSYPAANTTWTSVLRTITKDSETMSSDQGFLGSPSAEGIDELDLTEINQHRADVLRPITKRYRSSLSLMRHRLPGEPLESLFE